MLHHFTLIGHCEPVTITVAGVNGNSPAVNKHLAINQRAAEAYWDAFERKREELEQAAEARDLDDQVEECLEVEWANDLAEIERDWREGRRGDVREALIEEEARAAAEEAASKALAAILGE